MIEIIATTIEDATEIEAGGANRIELISALSEGGLTPSYGLIKEVISRVSIPVNVMIRPHSKNFIYTDDEIELMKKDIKIARDLGANGVVLGVLTKTNEIDTKKLESLLSVCHNLDVTFHRAIDETDVIASIKILAQYKAITNVLTSGGLGAPIEENSEIIKEMISYSKHINILLGGGLTLENCATVLKQTSATDAHLGSAVRVNDSVSSKKVATLLKV